MVKDAEAHASDDKKKRELAEARNQADSLVHQTEKSLGEVGEKLGEEEKTTIQTAVDELKAVKDGDDLEAIKAKTEALAQAAMKLGEALYQQEGGDAQAGEADAGAEGSAQGQADDSVVDAEFEEVDEDDKGEKKS
jgi:molecular chaperone DnaK